MQRRPFIGGNWKMHGDLQQLSSLLKGFKQQLLNFSVAEVVVFPSFVYLSSMAELLEQPRVIQLGGQNVCDQAVGAYTGEISAAMLKELTCRYVLIGHSERRAFYHETDDQIAEKFIQAQIEGLCPVLCVGETLAQREAGETEMVVCQQLKAVLRRAGSNAFLTAVLAYEPVWAIGTGQAATSDQAQAVHQTLRDHMAHHDVNVANQLRIIYGGSVTPATASDIFAQPDIDGGLIGGASLQAESFVAICQAVTAS